MIFKAVLLGLVEGITEFLPVSSTGHMIIVDNFLKLSKNMEFTNAFEIIIQLGAILSVIVYFWKELWPFSGSDEEKKDKWIMWSKVVVAVLPAVVLGLKFDKLIESKLFNAKVVATMLILYGIILIVLEIKNSKKKSFKINSIKEMGFVTAIGIGFFQCLAMVPGTSRSAATIIGGMLLGLNRAIAAEFSFFLAIPTMFGATLLKIVKSGVNFTSSEWGIIGVGFVVSFIVALIVIRWFMDYIKNKDFKIFGYYRIILGIIVLLVLKK
ncbi:undecaprenyl-diphosphate phosphatase [Haliovirga abyssi]|uniref:Undecaprenyl-diphosphatase n=1 Tax=Haliovirga abyssi TaxID=2996794 RepID=A0AAU9DC33_9FUSO|nr:undecaprenyl-diphosphate phosphatase [Haliovirga abyssi]BDU49847.1 undecaprenyl-diphosphatase 1 [Haliovirga abyssi]